MSDLNNASQVKQTFANKPISEWLIPDVVEWAIKSVGIDEEDAKELSTQKVDGEALKTMTFHQLKECGIPVGPTSKLYAALSKLLSSGSTRPQGEYYGPTGPGQVISRDYRNTPSYQNRGFYAPTITVRENWNIVQQPLHAKIRDMLQNMKGEKFVITGRRRLGKTWAVLQTLSRMKDENISYLFLSAQPSWRALSQIISVAINEFDKSLLPLLPLNELELVNFIAWLLRSGVHIVIDEFQLLIQISGFYDFLRERIDMEGSTWKGNLIILGSHVTEIERIITNQQSPLYGRGFSRYYVKPWTFSQIYKLLLPYHLDPLTIVGLYTCFDGVVALYEDAFVKLWNLQDAEQIVKLMFEVEPFYQSQLSPNHSVVLRVISDNDGEFLMKIYDNIPHRTSLKRFYFQTILDDLIRFGFCKVQKPWLAGGKEILKMTDCPTRLYKTKDFMSLQGTILEEIFRQLLEETNCLQAAVIDNYWAEHCTEIDIVAEDQQNKIVYWGSCERNGDEQLPWNLLCHVISFFNNRKFSEHPWYSWNHQLIFLSPTFTENKKIELNRITPALNTWLENSTQTEVVKKCKQHLSNYNKNRSRMKEENPNLISFTPTKDMPEKLSLRVQKCCTYDLKSLCSRIDHPPQI